MNIFKNKIVKKILIIFSITIASIFLILLVTPILFKGKILEIAKTEINKMLTAQVEFSDLKLSFIRNFPNAYVALEDLSVTGTDEFDGVTLAAFKRFSVTVDIMSVIKMDNIQVRSILLDRAEVNARILENGKANWDIMRPSDAPAQEAAQKAAQEAAQEAAEITSAEAAPKDDAPSALKIAIKKFEIRNTNLSFRDDANKMEATANDLNFFLQGDMTLDLADLMLKLDIASVSFWLDGVRLLNSAHVGFVSEVAADLKNMGFVFKDNQFNLNEIVLKFAGSLELPGDDINVDITFTTDKTDFKSLLSLVPAVYMQDFASVQTTGSLTLSGNLKGTLNDEQMPSGNVSLTVDNAMFKYPDLPKSVDNINIALNAFYDGVEFDNTTLDLDRFSFRIADNPFSAELHVKTPESDMQVAANFAGRIDFNSVADIVPLDDITLKGLLECDIALAGRMSTLEKEQYEDFDARGMLRISGFNFVSPDFPQAVQISVLQLNFSPRLVDLAAFDAVIGSSDISVNGRLEKFIPFIFAGETVSGSLTLRSNNIDLNEFMSDEPAEETVVEESAPLSIIEVPKNIDFAVNVNIGNLLFDKLKITNTAGRVLVRDGIVQMQNLSMNLLEGSMVLTGEYNTQDISVPSIDFSMNINRFDIPSALSSFSILERILPEPQNYIGRVSANLTLYSVLDENMGPVLDTVASKGRLQTHNLEILNSPIFGALADLLNNESWRNPAPDDLDIDFEIKDGRLIVEPIRFNITPVRLVLSGDQGLDMTMNYRLNTSVPVSLIGSGATDVLSKIPGGSNIREVTITGIIGGTVTRPSVNLSVADMMSNVAGAVREQVTTQVNEELNRQIESIMADAERQAQNIINNAKEAADRVRSEANSAAASLEREAASKSGVAGTLARAAAKTAADKLRSEGESNAVKLEQEAEKQAEALMDAARKRAEDLRR